MEATAEEAKVQSQPTPEPDQDKAELLEMIAANKKKQKLELDQIAKVEAAMPKVKEITQPKLPPRAEQAGPSDLPSSLSADHSSSRDSGNSRPKSPEIPKPRVSQKEKELAQFFQYRFGPLVVLVLVMFGNDWDQAAFYAPTPEECEGIAPHAAKLTYKLYKSFNIPDGVHEAIVNSDDGIALGYVVIGYLQRIGVLEKVPSLVSMIFGGKNAKLQRDSKPVQKAEVPNGSPSGGSPAEGGRLNVSNIRGLADLHRA